MAVARRSELARKTASSRWRTSSASRGSRSDERPGAADSREAARVLRDRDSSAQPHLSDIITPCTILWSGPGAMRGGFQEPEPDSAGIGSQFSVGDLSRRFSNLGAAARSPPSHLAQQEPKRGNAVIVDNPMPASRDWREEGAGFGYRRVRCGLPSALGRRRHPSSRRGRPTQSPMAPTASVRGRTSASSGPRLSQRNPVGPPLPRPL